jgi:Flp pilus assembly protein TadG
MIDRQRSRKVRKRNERGASMVELAFSGVAFLMAMFGLLEMGRYMTTQNTLAEAARRGARYAASQKLTDTSGTPTPVNRVKNMVVYKQTTTGTTPVAQGLTVSNVVVTYPNNTANWNIKAGEVTVSIENYQFSLTIPLMATTFTLKPIKATASAESAGYEPAEIP